MCKELEIKNEIKPFCTRYEYDSSDYIAWVIFPINNKEELKKIRDILLSIEYQEQKLFNVSGNGWGTGLSVMLNYNKYYK